MIFKAKDAILKKRAAVIVALTIIFVFAVGASVLYATSAAPDAPHYNYSECVSCHSDVADYHTNAGIQQYSDCISCHGDKVSSPDDQSLFDAVHNQYYDAPHKAHLTSNLLSFTCTTCHQSVDVREESASSVRRQVDIGLCAKCHSPFPATMDPAWATQDCISCHSDWQSQHASKAPYVNNANIGPSDCYGCHGGRAWYLSGAAALGLNRGNIYWANLSDYNAGKLSVDFSIANSGSGTANGLNISQVLSTNGVGVATPMPLNLGDVAEGGSTNFTLVYQVPGGVGFFYTTVYANAVNDDNQTQYWPSKP